MLDASQQRPQVGTTALSLMQAEGLRFRAAGRDVLCDIDLTIPAGRCTVILGANGAGKSVLLRLLHGLILPSQGKISWQGRAFDAIARSRQAMVFQRPVLLRRSVQANLRFALSVAGIAKAERKERERNALSAARLEDLAKRPARLLSGGEQQRLAVACALAREPQLMLLDEPTASLDPATTHQIEEQIVLARAKGVTIVLVTHDAGQARRVGDDVVFMDAGRIAEVGPVGSVLNAPQSAAAKAWLSGRLHLPARQE